MAHAKQILDKLGMSITVKNDKDALLLLASDGLTVWAAAWGSTIDPDMYQVYHKDSTAGSTLNWKFSTTPPANMPPKKTSSSIFRT